MKDKAILVIDQPINCKHCPFGSVVFGVTVCFFDEGNGIDCPLKPLPWKLKENNKYSEGYNACIDEILGEENEVY